MRNNRLLWTKTLSSLSPKPHSWSLDGCQCVYHILCNMCFHLRENWITTYCFLKHSLNGELVLSAWSLRDMDLMTSLHQQWPISFSSSHMAGLNPCVSLSLVKIKPWKESCHTYYFFFVIEESSRVSVYNPNSLRLPRHTVWDLAREPEHLRHLQIMQMQVTTLSFTGNKASLNNIYYPADLKTHRRCSKYKIKNHS